MMIRRVVVPMSAILWHSDAAAISCGDPAALAPPSQSIGPLPSASRFGKRYPAVSPAQTEGQFGRDPASTKVLVLGDFVPFSTSSL